MINEVFYSHDLKCRVKQISKRTVRKFGLNGGLEYYLALEAEIGRIVNDERNW